MRGVAAGAAVVASLAGGLAHAEPLTHAQCRTLLGLDGAPLGPLREAAVRNLGAAALEAPDADSLRRAAEAVIAATSGGDATIEGVCRSLVVEPVARQALLTGYYVPVVPARRSRDETFQHPLYALPAPALRQHSRAEIDRGALDGTVSVVAWLADPVEAFFIHIQGSARLALPDGQMAVGYAGSNGRAYTSIGAVLIADERMRREEVSMESLKAYLREHPNERDAILHANERYIFFREIAGEPVGSLGVPVTAGRSVAADPAAHPPGTLLFIRPRDGSTGVSPRLVFVQDRGSAITGPARLDLFVGTGDEAGRIAGPLQQQVDVFVLRPMSTPR
jgi:membrane-bound lytic murein transglycosylase A